MLRDEAIKKAELLFQALDADGDGSLTQVNKMTLFIFCLDEEAPSYASPKLRPSHLLTYLLTGVKCTATSVAKNLLFL